MQVRTILVAAVAVVAVLCVGGAYAEGVSVANAESLAYKQEAAAFATLSAMPPKTPADWTSEDAFMASFVELQADGMRKKSRAMALRFVEKRRAALRSVDPAPGALAAAAKSGADFDKNFRAHCKRVSPSRKMCKNFVTILRLQFMGQNPFAVKNGNRKRFSDSVHEIILRYVVAWRRQHPKRSTRAAGNPWSPVAIAAAAKASKSPEGLRVDPMYDVEISTGVRGGLNTFGRINADPSKGERVLNVPRRKDYPVGTALDNPYDSAKPYKARKHVKHLREQVMDDLTYLRDKLYTKINDKKFHRMIGDPERAPKAIRRTARLCSKLRAEHFFPPTFCRSLEYLASVNFVGRNFMRNLKDFSALMASFMDHNHEYVTRYGSRVHRKPNYRQDVTVVRAKLALRLRSNRFNLRTFSREFVNVASNVLAVPQSRIRIASVRLGGFHKLPGRRHTVVTFEFLPKKGDRRIRSRPHKLGSVDSLAEQFRAMALNRPASDFYKVPILSRILPKSLVLSKTLGRRPRKFAKALNLQTKNVPRFAAVDQTLASDVEVTTEEVEEGEAEAADAETTEFEQSDSEFSDADETVDAADTESAEDAEAIEATGMNAADAEEAVTAVAIAAQVADIEEHVEDTYAAAFDAQLQHVMAQYENGEAADTTEADAEAEVAQQSEAEAEAETEAAEAEGEVALLQVHAEATDAVTQATETLHLSADTMTEEEEAEEEAAEDAEDAAEEEAQDEEEAAAEGEAELEVETADQDEAEADAEDEDEAESEEEADEEVDELDELADEQADNALSADEEVETDAAWQSALLQNREQLVASSEADDALDLSDESGLLADDEADADDENEADDELDAEVASSSASDSNAPIAPAESLPTLPEVNAVMEDSASEQKVTARANSDKAAAADSVVAQALAAVDAEEAVSETVFVETATTVKAKTMGGEPSAANPRATATAFVPLIAAALLAAVKLW